MALSALKVGGPLPHPHPYLGLGAPGVPGLEEVGGPGSSSGCPPRGHLHWGDLSYILRWGRQGTGAEGWPEGPVARAGLALAEVGREMRPDTGQGLFGERP